jgi:hypothetical protein
MMEDEEDDDDKNSELDFDEYEQIINYMEKTTI